MHVISRKRLLEATRKQGELSSPLDAWFRVAKAAKWGSLVDVRETLPTADPAGKYTVFNIKGNAYRLITEINYAGQRVYIRHILTHAQYDKGEWNK